MKIAYFLPLGGSLESLRKTGQDERFLANELFYYLEKFEEICIFDYSAKKYNTGDKRITQIYNIRSWHRFFFALFFPIKYRKIISQCDVVRASHLTGVIPAIMTKILYGKPFVFNYAYDYFRFAWLEKKYFRAIFIKFFEVIAFFFADGVIFANKKMYINNSQFWNINKIYVPNGVNTKIFTPHDKAINKGDVREYRILFVGRLEKQKNISNLIEAIGMLHDKKVKINLIGQGKEKKNIEYFCKKNDIVCGIISRVDNKNLVGYYQSCDLFILPSITEGSPKVLLEAMSCGALCLVSDIPENTEIIQDRQNGFTAGVSRKEIADKIKYIMRFEKADTEKIKSMARKTIEENYSISTVMKKEVNFVASYA